MYEKYKKTMFLRRRFRKRVVLMVLFFGISFYVTTLLLGDLKSPVVMRLTDLHRCPACYGTSVCPELYSNQITLETKNHWSSIFNAKNIFYGYTKSNRRVILKKLAHDWELREFDAKICSSWNLRSDCIPGNLLNVSNIEEGIVKVVKYNFTWPDAEPRKGLIMCPYPFSIFDFIQPLLVPKGNHKSEMINIWTMLRLNPEPIILQILQKVKGWPVPAFAGVCGRLEVLAHEGEPLMSLLLEPWHRRLKFAKYILEAALDFTFKHDRFRFYLMDWSLDNIVVNQKDQVTFVDLEDVVVLDKHISPKSDLPHWYQRYTREDIEPGFTFSIENMCQHHLSDHNIWAACYILAGDENPLLLPIPKEVTTSRPHFTTLLYECLNGDSRFVTVGKLQHVISDILNDVPIS